MNVDFESLYSLVENLNKSTKEKCLICHFPIEQNELVLTCNHYYHSQCLNKKTNNIKCPYCEKNVKVKTTDLVPVSDNNGGCKVLLVSGARKGEYCGRTNCTYHKLTKDKIKIIQNPTGCQVILKSGDKKGQVCGRNNCKIHKKINL
jgi:hypothetical protein